MAESVLAVGNWTEDVTLTGWGRFLNSLAQVNSIEEVIIDDEWGQYVSASFLPLAVFLIGLVLAAVVVVRLCCCAPRLSDNRGKSMTPSICWGALAFTFAVLGLIVFTETTKHGGHVATESLSRAVDDTNAMCNSTLDLNSTATNMLLSLDVILSSCDLPQKIEEEITLYSTEIQSAVDQVSLLHSNISLLSSKLNELQDHGGGRAAWGVSAATLSLPLLLTTLVCAGMFCLLCGTSCLRQGSSCAKCQDICFFKIGSIGLAITILVVAALSCGQLMAGIVLSSFCSDADANTLLVLNASIGPDTHYYSHSGPDTWEAALYYIGAEGENPYMVQLTNVSATLDEVAEVLPHLRQVAQPCGQEASEAVESIGENLEEANAQAGSTETILEPTNVYRYYADAVHRQVCGPVIDGLGWIALSQIVVGMICLPFLSCTVESYVHRRGLEQQQVLLQQEPVQISLG